MGDTTNPGLPTSWRDVHTLVRDSSERIEAKIDTLDLKFNQHLIDHAGSAGEARGRASNQAAVIGFGRSTIALALSLLSGAVALVAVVRGG